MLRVASIVRKPAVKSELVADTVVLDHEARARNALKLHGEAGTVAEFSSDRDVVLRDGDAFKLDDGRLIAVRAAPEKLLEVTAENPLRLMRLAWQLGSRHAAVEATAAALFVADTPELQELVRSQGCTAQAVERPFDPEQAAPGHDCCQHGHRHDHGHHHHGDGDCGCGGDGKHDHGKHDHGGHEHGKHGHGGHERGHGHAHAHRDDEHTHEHEHGHRGEGEGCGCGCGGHGKHGHHGKDHHGKDHHGKEHHGKHDRD